MGALIGTFHPGMALKWLEILSKIGLELSWGLCETHRHGRFSCGIRIGFNRIAKEQLKSFVVNRILFHSPRLPIFESFGQSLQVFPSDDRREIGAIRRDYWQCAFDKLTR